MRGSHRVALFDGVKTMMKGITGFCFGKEVE
jgi:hypothetical protein